MSSDFPVIEQPQAPLNRYEREDLAECEGIIERGLQTFYEVGNALAQIRDQRLYREKYGTFEEYCRTKWDMKSSRARQLIAAAMVAEDLEKSVTTVTLSSERQMRPLVGLSTDDRQAAWTLATQQADGNKLTATQVQSAADEISALKEAVSAAGGIWYSSRDGQHRVSLPNQPQNALYSSEALRAALGIATVEAAASPATAPKLASAIARQQQERARQQAERQARDQQEAARQQLAARPTCPQCGKESREWVGKICQPCYIASRPGLSQPMQQPATIPREQWSAGTVATVLNQTRQQIAPQPDPYAGIEPEARAVLARECAQLCEHDMLARIIACVLNLNVDLLDGTVGAIAAEIEAECWALLWHGGDRQLALNLLDLVEREPAADGEH